MRNDRRVRNKSERRERYQNDGGAFQGDRERYRIDPNGNGAGSGEAAVHRKPNRRNR